MTEVVIFAVLFALLFTVIVFVSRWQARQYRDYLAKHGASNDQLVESQTAIRETAERQNAALERIATALEKSRQG